MVRSKGEAGWRMHRCRCSQHVAGVTERWNVADGGHVSGEGGGVKGAALGKVFKVVMDLFALFGFARHFSVSGLNSFFLHSQGSVNLNKNQLFFLCFHPLLPKSPGGSCTPCTGSPRDVPRTSWAAGSPPPPLVHPTCHSYTTSPPRPKIQIPPGNPKVGRNFWRQDDRKLLAEPHRSKTYPNNSQQLKNFSYLHIR